jgi:endoplasmic reticulum chaperone BiP
MDKLLARAAPYTKLGLFGAAVGPLVDEIHNQAILQYDILPISVDLPVGIIKTSLLIPPLLAVAYVVLGGVLPQVVTRRVPSSNVIMKPLQVEQTQQFRAMAGVLSTCCIIKVSEILATNGVSAAPSIILLSVLSFLQFLALDGSYASLILAFTAAIFGPLSELPFMSFGCWHYINPDYFPLVQVVQDQALGLASITGPCYFVVTTDAILVGKACGIKYGEPP